MVKLSSYAPLLSLTLTTSLALAAPHPSLLERDLDEEFSRREYLSYDFDDLAARDPSFFGDVGNVFKDVGREAAKGLNIAEKVAENPMVQTATSLLPGGGELVVAEKVLGAVGKFERAEEKAKAAGRKIHKLEGSLRRNKKVDKELRKAKGEVRKAEKQIGGAERKVKEIRRAEKQSLRSERRSEQRRGRHHRRDLEDDEELLRRDLDDEELFVREYDEFLAERDFFDDLD